MSEILNQATTEIQNWNIIRNNAPITIPIFNNGSYFKLTPSAYSKWQSILNGSGISLEDQSIHAYLSVTEPSASGVLSMFGVDNHTDSLPVSGHEANYNDSLQFISYETANLPNPYFNQESLSANGIDPLTALQQSTQWTLHKDMWLGNQTNMAQILVIPFKDLKTLFDTTNPDFLILQPAFSLLDEEGVYQLQMDLIIWSYSDANGIAGKYPEDLIQPVPPYTSVYPSSAFQLLQYAL